MYDQMASQEYAQALRRGQKEYRELLMAGKRAHPAVLDELLPEISSQSVQEVGLVEVPAERILGTVSAGRITAFTASFDPLLDPKSEFGRKWIALCEAHLGPSGITDPILCYEYLGNFYVQEGNKRVSVLRHFGAPRITANVRRILPPVSDDPRIRAYYEFLEFYKQSRIYQVQFRRPGDYGRLLQHLGKERDEKWSEDERRSFRSCFHYFQEAFDAQSTRLEGVTPEEALLLWLQIHPFQELGSLSAPELKKSLSALWEDVRTTGQNAVKLETKAQDRRSFLERLTASGTDHLNVAFVHQLTAASSAWVTGHEEGRAHIEYIFGDRITVRSYFEADTLEQADLRIQQAVDDGAQVVFTTAPLLSRATLKAAVRYPKVRFLNCSVDQPYSSVRTYYGRIYEAKFITGAIAGAMARDGRIGYVASYPIFGVPASINAFALGAQMTNPRAQVELRWSCLPGTPQADLLAGGIRVISNREAPAQSRRYLEFCSYGTYMAEDRGSLIPLATPSWGWGRFYEFVLRSIFSGGWKQEKGVSPAVNYWLGMDSGVIGLSLSEKLPEGVRQMARLLHRSMVEGKLDPFFRRILAQDGTEKNDGSRTFTPEQLLKMDWLCQNVRGEIPQYEQLLPSSRAMVRELGVYREGIPSGREGAARADLNPFG